MRIGILNDVLGVSALDAYEVAGKIGFDGIELGIRATEARSHPAWDPDARRRLQAAAAAHGVATASLCLHGWGGLAADPGQRAGAVALAQE
ncbi:MAG TPA: hypothetical protein VF234_08040, partial [Limnochordia bacterium]